MKIFFWEITSSKTKQDKSESKTMQIAESKPMVDYTASIVANSVTTKGLYFNTLVGYKLGAGLCYNMIQVVLNFCGFPIALIEDSTDQEKIETAEFFQAYNQDFIKILKQCHREGTIWIYPWFDSKSGKVKIKFIEDSWRTKTFVDPQTGELQGIITTKDINVLDHKGNVVQVVETVKYEKNKITTNYESSAYSGLKNSVQRNPIGMLPIDFANMTDGGEIGGHSDYARALPYIMNYHRTKLAMATELNDFRTKLVQNTGDQTAKEWLCSQGFESLAAWIVGAGVQKSQVILNSGQYSKTEFITAKGMVDGYLKSLDNDYKMIVETCGVPELFWGLKQQGNANTAEEAMTTLINYIMDKRAQSTHPFEMLMGSMLFLDSLSRGSQFDKNIKISWDQLDAVSDSSRAEIFKNFCDGISKAFQGQTLTIKQSYNLWKKNYPDATDMTEDEFETGITQATALLNRKTATSEIDLGNGLD
jgi:hypothetical protein